MNEWTRICVTRYVREIAEYEKRIQAGIERGKVIRAQMEGIQAVRYDRDGSRSEYMDRRPEALDTLAKIADSLDADIRLWAEEAEAAHRLFDSTIETRVVWLKWGRQGRNGANLTMQQVAQRVGYSRSSAYRLYERGFEIIYRLMPEEYRRSPYPAEEWEDETK